MFKNETDFNKIVRQLNIDDKPNPAHREKLRRQMLSAFNETGKQPITQSRPLWRTIMKGTIKKFAAAAAVIIVVAIGAYYLKPNDSVTMVDVVPEQPTTNNETCLLYTSPSPRDATLSRMPSSA